MRRRNFLCVCVHVKKWLTFELGPDWCSELSPFASGSLSANLQHRETRDRAGEEAERKRVKG